MGAIVRHPIGKWRERYGLQAFVETGTWKGRGVRSALIAGFPEIWTIEASEKLSLAARGNLTGAEIHWVVGDSSEKLREILPYVSEPALFWLDAHYPHLYEGDEVTQLPLLFEIGSIVASERDHSEDVIVVDDLRIYGVTGGKGPLPPGFEAGTQDELDDIMAQLDRTHRIILDGRDQAYLVALPRTRPVTLC